VGLVLSRRGAHGSLLRAEVAWHAVGAWWVEAGRGARGWGFEGDWEVRTGRLGVWESGREWKGLEGIGRDWEGLGVTGTGGRRCGTAVTEVHVVDPVISQPSKPRDLNLSTGWVALVALVGGSRGGEAPNNGLP